MKIGYVRVSKADESQVFDLQIDALIKEGVDRSRIYEDKLSGSIKERPGLNECLKSLREGDILFVWKLDRLGRSLKNLIDIVEDLNKRNIGFKILSGSGEMIDTTSPNGRFVFNIFAALAEFERELIIERTKAGIEAARARGKKGGRPKKMSQEKIEAASLMLKDKSSSFTKVAKMLNIGRSTLHAYINPDGTRK